MKTIEYDYSDSSEESTNLVDEVSESDNKLKDADHINENADNQTDDLDKLLAGNNIEPVLRNVDLDHLLQCNIIINQDRSTLVAVGDVLLVGPFEALNLLIGRIHNQIPTTIGIIDSEFVTVNNTRELLDQCLLSIEQSIKNKNDSVIISHFKSIYREVSLNSFRLFIINEKVYKNWLDNSVISEDNHGVQYSLYDFVNKYSSMAKYNATDQDNVNNPNSNERETDDIASENDSVDTTDKHTDNLETYVEEINEEIEDERSADS